MATRKFSELRAAIAADPIRAERLRHVTEAVNQTYEGWADSDIMKISREDFTKWLLYVISAAVKDGSYAVGLVEGEILVESADGATFAITVEEM